MTKRMIHRSSIGTRTSGVRRSDFNPPGTYIPIFNSNENLPEAVKVVEVGPRDGLQNEKQTVDTDVKVKLIRKLVESGLPSVEVTAFVSPKWVPQMADGAEVVKRLNEDPPISPHGKYSMPVLVPNLKGLQAAIEAGVKEIAIFASASESFSRKNINTSIAHSLDRYEDVCMEAKANGLPIRGYVSCVLGCPYEGVINPRVVASVTRRMVDMGCYEVSLGDTIGVGTAGTTATMLSTVCAEVPSDYLAVHFHDTYGEGKGREGEECDN
eukprot:TRINITY_DN1436_c0_g1_i3.p1 TRINITY_DN1436_c0_g1~~TRINITY_DN1436_c0_g1_i3.p1  ORF type:complete len:296 (-),score=68.52 TRINITY_DN1436_c0_g1_i3:446-1249(-)